jgi:hypothetical protein
VINPFTIINSSAKAYGINFGASASIPEFILIKKVMAGDNKHINGTNLSFTDRFLTKIPKANNPKSGPYVYDATLNISFTTD